MLLLAATILAGTLGVQEEERAPPSASDGSPVPAPVRLIAELDFEHEKRGTARLGTAGLESALGRTRIVSSPVRSGRHAFEVHLDRATGEHRTDFYLRGVSGVSRLGQEYWYGFSVRFPEDWEPDTQNELFVQWVRTTETPGGPQLAIYVVGEQYVLRKRWDPDPEDGVQEVEYANLWRSSLLEDRGKWVDWVVHVRWSRAGDGLVELWKDGTSILRHSGPNCYNDGGDEAPYFKFGVYKWPWAHPADETPSAVSTRRLVFDEIRIGDATASFAAVSPPGD